MLQGCRRVRVADVSMAPRGAGHMDVRNVRRHSGRAARQTAIPALPRGTRPLGALQQPLSAAAFRDVGDMTAATARLVRAMATRRSLPVDQAGTRVTACETQSLARAARARHQAADIAAGASSRGARLDGWAPLPGALASRFGRQAGAVDPSVTAQALRATRLRFTPPA